jgi:hypothetical protein
LSLPYEGRGEQELRLALTEHLLQNCAADRRAVLIMDEAQHLSPELLEELRLLANLEAPRARALQVVLVAQPDIHVMLARPALRALAQRLAVRVQLEPLGPEEAADYLLHQVRASGGRPDDLLTEEAVEILARGTGGVPRLLNQAAHQALTLAYTAGAALVDAEAALEALDHLGLSDETEPGKIQRLTPPEGPGADMDDDGEPEAVGDEVLSLGADETKAQEADAPKGDGKACRLFPSPRPA